MKEFTIKQIADELNITKPTVRKYLRQLKIEPIRVEANRLLYSAEAANSIAAEVGSSFLFETEISENQTEKIGNETEISENQNGKTENKTENSENKTEISENGEAFASVLALLREEIAKKDKEIAELKAENQKKDERIDNYIAEIIKMSGNAQYITAADKTAAIMDKSQLQQDNSKTVNKKWYQFWK